MKLYSRQMKSAMSIAPTAAAKRHVSNLKNYRIRFFRLRLCVLVEL